MMERKFGIELEVVEISQATALQALRAIGINVVDESYNHSTRRHWKLVPDASVRGGFEVVSPVLRGEAGIEEAMAVTTALDDAGAQVNRSCGFHVHFDASDLTVGHLRTIVRRYAAHEAEIDNVMPLSRRGGANTFCNTLGGIVDRVSAPSTIRDMAMAQPGRYYKINLQSFMRHGTIEFRQHSGTVNANKVGNWVRFLGEFMDACREEAAPVAEVPVADHPALRGVQGQLAGMFTAAGTVRLSAMCDRFGWQPHTARAAVTRLRQAGLQIVSVKDGGESAYRLVSGLAATARPQADSLWRGISESVVRFYQRRAAVLAAVV